MFGREKDCVFVCFDVNEEGLVKKGGEMFGVIRGYKVKDEVKEKME